MRDCAGKDWVQPVLRRLSVYFLLAGACAKMEPPPGGPADQTPPTLISTRPESTAVFPGFDGAVEFRFDEVISEGSQASQGLGTSELERLLILSPTTQVPKVKWKRTAITIEPREGWRSNRVYRVELLPGIVDLQRNRLDSGAVVTFSTGAPLPGTRLSGTVVDWQAGRLAGAAMVEALLLPDSLSYRALTDSGGNFNFGPLPRGEYLVYGVIDQNRNLRREFRDNFDTVRVQPDSGNAGTLWAAPHDTTGPRLQTAAIRDSVAVELTFNQPVDPYQTLDSANARLLLLPDSTPVAVTSLFPRGVDDSVQTEIRRVADSGRVVDTTRAALDSARAAALAKLRPGLGHPANDSATAILVARPSLSDRLILRVAAALDPGRRYVVEAWGIRNVNRVYADSRLPLSVPERAPPAEPDSLEPVRPDSVPADSALPPPKPR